MKLDKKTISLIIVFVVVVSIVAIAASFISGYHFFGDATSDAILAGMNDFMRESMKSGHMPTQDEMKQKMDELLKQQMDKEIQDSIGWYAWSTLK
jgi:hypothetical protein